MSNTAPAFPKKSVSSSVSLIDGETLIKQAPVIALKNGTLCTPQHFLEYKHTCESVEKIASDITFDERVIVFVAQENDQTILQIGIIGRDNYSTSESDKIVYGRKWRVEPTLPTSEIIQTIFLATVTSREHEIREIFRLNHNVEQT